jgi:HSP20 family protein
MVSLHHAVNQLFDDFFMSFELMPLTEFEDLCAFIPRVDMTDDGQTIKVTVELPGMERDSIEVGVDSDRLTIRGNKAGDDTPQAASNYCMERVFGTFNRTIPLPKGIDTARASAVYRNGILIVTIPRRTGHKATKRIKISNGE